MGQDLNPGLLVPEPRHWDRSPGDSKVNNADIVTDGRGRKMWDGRDPWVAWSQVSKALNAMPKDQLSSKGREVSRVQETHPGSRMGRLRVL